MRIGPFARMLNRLARWQCCPQLPRGRQVVHSLAPSAKCRIFWVHSFAFLGEAEGKRARQNEEIGKREFGAEQIVISMRQLAFQHAEPEFDLWQRVRHDLLFGGDAELRKYQPLVS